MQTESQFERELNLLCIRAAAEIADHDETEPESDRGLVDFANRTIFGGANLKNDNELESLFTELLREMDVSNAVRSADETSAIKFVSDFMADLCSAPIILRANGRKIANFDTLLSAVNTLSISGPNDDDDLEPWATFSNTLASGDFALFEGDFEGFRSAVVGALDTAFKHPDFSFVVLAKAIQRQQADDEIRRLRKKLGLRGKRAATRPAKCSVHGCTHS